MRLSFSLVALAGITFIFSSKNEINYTITPPDVRSEIGTRENPRARSDYESRMVTSPFLGMKPNGMRKREIAFGKKLVGEAKYIKAARRTTQKTWEIGGPYNVGGRTRGADIDIKNTDIIIAGGVSGGIWKTDNGGGSWTRTTEPDSHPGITWITQDKRAGKTNTWYAGTGELVGNSAKAQGAPFRGNGLLKSTDNGTTWIPLESTTTTRQSIFNSQFQYIWNIVVNQKKADIDELYVAAIGGVVRSQDGGDTWEILIGKKLFGFPEDTNLSDQLTPFNSSIIQTHQGHFFASLGTSVDQNRPDIIYSDGGLFFSENGDSWQTIMPPTFPEYHERTVIAANKAGNKVYFLTHHDTFNTLWLFTFTSVIDSKPIGFWQDLSANLPAFGGSNGDYNAQEAYNMMITVHPENDNIVFIGGTNLYRSTDAFLTSRRTQWIGGYDPKNNNSQYPSHHADQHLLLFYPNSGDKFISCHDGGVSYTDDALRDSVIYTSLNNGYLTSQFYTIAQQQDKATNIIMGGMQDNGSYVRQSNTTNPSWSRLISGDGTYVAIAPNQDFVYSGFQKGIIYRLNITSSGQIKNFARVDPPLDEDDYLFVNPYILDPLNANKMYQLAGNTIWRNRNLTQIPNGSQNQTSIGWERLPDTRLSSTTHKLPLGIYTAIDKSDNMLYAGIFDRASPPQRPHIMRVNNAGNEDQEEVELLSPPNFPAGGYISCIATDPDNPNELLVVCSNYEIPSLYWSQDGGESFITVGGNLEENLDGSGDGPSLRWAEVVPTLTGNKYFIGTSIGLFSSDELKGDNTVWVKEGAETIGRSVVTMLDFRRLDGRMIVATHGSGTFLTYIAGAKPQQKAATLPFQLQANYPNPFDDETLIKYILPTDGEVKIDIFDNTGKMVKNLIWGPHYAGANSVVWDGTNDKGTFVENGIYHCKLTFGGSFKSKRMILMR